jgi:adenylate cyclase
MATEIERKFLVTNDSWRAQVISKERLKQGYLANQGNASVRVRVGRSKAFLNIKSAVIGVQRAEFEYPVPLEDAELMLSQLAQGPLIDKTRYKVRHGERVWELDVFYGENQGLVVAEIELSAPDEALELPDWAGEEVSDDARFYNHNLTSHPYTRW